MRLRSVLAILMTLMFISSLPAVDILYVAVSDDRIVSYDTTGNDGTYIGATAATFVSTNLKHVYGGNNLAFDSLGNLYAANYGNDTFSKYNSTGVYQSTIGNIPNHDAILNMPTGLAFDSSGNIYVSNNNGRVVTKFDSSGVYQSTIGSHLRVNGLSNLMGIALDSSDNLYVSNSGFNLITRFEFNSSGVHQTTNYIDGTHLDGPIGLAFDSSSNLYVVNANGNFISKYNSSGVYLSTIGNSSNLNSPMSIAIDSLGNIYASNLWSRTISKFDPAGNFITSWGTAPADPLSTVYPMAIAFRPSAVTVPEPSTYALATIASGVLAIWLARNAKST